MVGLFRGRQREGEGKGRCMYRQTVKNRQASQNSAIYLEGTSFAVEQ